MSARREQANQEAFRRLVEGDPVLIDVQKAIDVLPGMQPNMVLTSGRPLPWDSYVGAQRMAILYGAMYESLAETVEEADRKIRSGEILVASTHEHGVAGAHTGIHTASTPVFVVEDRATGTRGHSSLFEGDAPRRLNQGCYGDDVIALLRFVDDILAPTLGEAIRKSGGIPLRPIVRRSLNLGDDLHMRTVAATLLFTRALFPALLELSRERPEEVRRTVSFLETAEYSFFRVELAMVKALTDAATGVEGSSLVTKMAMSCDGFDVQVSGLGRQWFGVPQHPTFEGKFFRPETRLEDCGFYGTDSVIVECLGVGAFAGAAAFALQNWSSSERLVARSLAMYTITHGEHPEFKIPYFNFRGIPTGIDVFKVLETGTVPLINGFIVNMKGHGLAGAGTLHMPLGAFQAAADAYRARYGDE